jgi:hypothetical protein
MQAEAVPHIATASAAANAMQDRRIRAIAIPQASALQTYVPDITSSAETPLVRSPARQLLRKLKSQVPVGHHL